MKYICKELQCVYSTLIIEYPPQKISNVVRRASTVSLHWLSDHDLPFKGLSKPSLLVNLLKALLN